ncbi:MAG: LysM peptidoglycan-binding domain-containing protein [Cellulomonas sp.]
MTQTAPAAPGSTIRAAEASPRHAQIVGGSTRRRVTGTGATATLVLVAVAVTATGGAAHADDQYTVRTGDTVGHIAARTGTTVAAIARANALADAARIRVGQRLVIPTSSAVSATAAPVVTVTAPAAATYTVAKGDTVSRIATKQRTTTAAIIAANGLDARGFIRIGQQLTIPGADAATVQQGAAATPAPPTTATHTVVSGETVSAIAKKFGTTTQAIVAANGLNARAFVRIGQQLTIPVVSTAATATATATMRLVSNTFAGRTYSDSVVAAANVNQGTLLSLPVPTKAQMQAKIVATARQMGVDPSLAQAIAFQESGFNHTSVSPANAIGVMQVIPSSGEWASQLVGRTLNLLNPDDNVVAGIAILRSLVKTGPDLSTSIAGYYQGASSVRRNGMFADTRRYVANVQTHMTRFS